MYCKIKPSKLTFKLTDLLGLISLVHPLYMLAFMYPPNYLFYVGIGLSVFFLSFNLFGIVGYYVKIDNVKVSIYDNFIPHYIKIKNITEIDKQADKIVLKTIEGKVITIDFDKILKTERYKTNDLYYDIHNKTQRKSLKDIEQLT